MGKFEALGEPQPESYSHPELPRHVVNEALLMQVTGFMTSPIHGQAFQF